MEMQPTDSNAYAYFAGMVFPNSHFYIGYVVLNNVFRSWIIDTGANDHVTFDSTYFLTQHYYQTLSQLPYLIEP